MILREREAGSSTADVCQKHGVSSATFYKWKATYAGMDLSHARKLKLLEDENARLTRLIEDAMLDNAKLKDVASKLVRPGLSQRAVEDVRRPVGNSERRACTILCVDRSSMR